MRMNIKNLCLSIVLLASAGLFGYPLTVHALDLQEAKSQGFVGEKSNGYLGVVKAAPGVNELVNRINDARRQHYQDIARRNGTSLDIVEQLAGKKAIEKTPAGQYIQLPPGSWLTK